MKYLDPVGAPLDRAVTAARPALATLAGRRLAIVNNGWASMERLGEYMARLSREALGVREVAFFSVPRNHAPPEGVLARVHEGCDAALVGLAN